MPDQDAATTADAILRRPRRRTVVIAAIAAVALAAVATAVTLTLLRVSETDAATPPTATPPSAADAFERPADWSPHRPAVHFTPEKNWMNDPQKPILLDGVWHYYYLYNADYPDGNGTAWYHATSTDLVHWKDQGVAIEKYANGLGDIWTGTAVVDHENTAGFGPAPSSHWSHSRSTACSASRCSSRPMAGTRSSHTRPIPSWIIPVSPTGATRACSGTTPPATG